MESGHTWILSQRNQSISWTYVVHREDVQVARAEECYQSKEDAFDGLKNYFLNQIHEVLQKKIRIDAWCAALAIPQPMLDPADATINDVTDAIDNRDKEIRADLIEFVRGQRVRIDVNTPPPPRSASATTSGTIGN